MSFVFCIFNLEQMFLLRKRVKIIKNRDPTTHKPTQKKDDLCVIMAGGNVGWRVKKVIQFELRLACWFGTINYDRSGNRPKIACFSEYIRAQSFFRVPLTFWICRICWCDLIRIRSIRLDFGLKVKAPQKVC